MMSHNTKLETSLTCKPTNKIKSQKRAALLYCPECCGIVFNCAISKSSGYYMGCATRPGRQSK